MNVIIKKGTAKGIVKAPPSKSYAHRMLICAALAADESIVRGISGSEDMLATMDCMKQLGCNCETAGNDAKVSRSGSDIQTTQPESDTSTSRSGSESENADSGVPIFSCRESGSTLRFFIPIALALTGGGIFRGTQRLIERGIGIYEDLFEPIGIQILKNEDSITLKGRLQAGTYGMRGDISSQFVTGLLFALPLLEGDSVVEVLPPVESRAYIDITIDVMKQFGVKVDEPKPGYFVICGNQHYMPRDAAVEGDWSNAAFLYAIQRLQMLNDGHKELLLEVEGLRSDSIQGDRVCLELFDKLQDQTGEAIDISGCPDLGPILFAFAAACRGGRFTGTRRLRIKESDRAAAMQEELAKFGIRMDLLGDNDLEILPGTLHRPAAPVEGHNDHRIVMACAVLMTLTGGEICGAEAVRKSYPDFFDALRSVEINVEETVQQA